jgi:deoxyadenosine/deoxycytidine kinase
MDSQFNAIDYSHQLQAVGVSQEQAEIHAKLLSQALTNCAASLADLNSLGERLNARMSAFEARIDARMSAFEERITARMDAFEERIEARMGAFEERITARMDAFEARIDLKLERMDGEQKVLRWMCATNTALMIAVIVKIYFP